MRRPPGLRRVLVAAALAGPLLLGPPRASAQSGSGDPSPASSASRSWFREISVHGLASVSSVGRFGAPVGQPNAFRLLDADNGTIQLDVGQLQVVREVARPGDLGFRTDWLVGSATEITAASGLFRDAAGEAAPVDLLQAYVSYVAPLGRGVRLDAGKFVTHIGYEVIEGYDGFNDTHSHSWLFTYAEPVSHTGVRVSYPLSAQLSAQVLVVNGWDTFHDNNGGRSVGAQVRFDASPETAVVLAYMGGPEQPGNEVNVRHTLDAWASTRAGRATFAVNYGYGREDQAQVAESAGGGTRDCQWQGLAGYVRYQAASRLAASLRAEWFDDSAGVRTGYAQSLRGLTISPEFRAHPRVVLRSDLRRDVSSLAVFAREDGSFGRSQITLSLNTIFRF